MAFHAPQKTSQRHESERVAADNALIAARTKAEVAIALSTLDSRYKENVAAYAEALHNCTHRIETVHIEIEHLKEKQQPYLDAIEEMEKEIGYEVRMLERLSEQYIQKQMIITELQKELADLPTEERSLSYRQEELATLTEEIERLELSLLEHELVCQNHRIALEPLQQEVRAKKKELRALEAEKHYIETTHLHRITQVGGEPHPRLLESRDRSEG